MPSRSHQTKGRVPTKTKWVTGGYRPAGTRPCHGYAGIRDEDLGCGWELNFSATKETWKKGLEFGFDSGGVTRTVLWKPIRSLDCLGQAASTPKPFHASDLPCLATQALPSSLLLLYKGRPGIMSSHQRPRGFGMNREGGPNISLVGFRLLVRLAFLEQINV